MHASSSLFFLVAFCVFLPLAIGKKSREHAWNGHVSTELQLRPGLFMPYYVPPGAKSYDSASPLVLYSGSWSDSYSSRYSHRTLKWSTDIKASVRLSFTGTGIEWFGNMGPKSCLADVFIDGELVQTVDPHQDTRNTQQRIFWKYDLSYGKHVIKLVNTGKHRYTSVKKCTINVDAFVVTKGKPALPRSKGPAPRPAAQNAVSNMLTLATATSMDSQAGKWRLTLKGSTGVHAMQLVVISSTHALIIDKVEHNPLNIGGRPAWAALYDLENHAVNPLSVQSNSFCAGGTFLGNGTLVDVGGNPIVHGYTAAADFGDLDGLQAVRLFHPCDGKDIEKCNIYENHDRIRMASPRWYNTVLRISDGSAMIIGGSKKGGWINNATVNNPTLEYFPPKSIHGSNGSPIDLPFFVDTLNSNLFPLAFSLPDGRIFVAANQDAMIYDWENNHERRLPSLPNGVRVTYPMTGTGLLLPLTYENNYEPEVLLCGGSTIDDKQAGHEISSQDVASSHCFRMLLTEEGIGRGWEIEDMPEARIMADAVLLPTGDLIIINGAGSGISGYGNVQDRVGASNADNPILTPVLYKPSAPRGRRFVSQDMPTSDIPRMYHSVATLTPSGDVMIAGSNPNLDRSAEMFGTEYRVEWLSPPYMAEERPEIKGNVKQLGFGNTMQLEVQLTKSGAANVQGMFLVALGEFFLRAHFY